VECYLPLEAAHEWLAWRVAQRGVMQVIQRNPYFAEIVDRYGGDNVVLERVKGARERESSVKFLHIPA
jgi:hypothetical protein